MATNLKTVLDAIAAGPFAPTVLNAVKPSGAEAIRKTYPQMPDSTPMTPCLVLMPQNGEFIEGGAAVYNETHNVNLWFVYSFKTGDIERAETQRQLWVGTLAAAFFATAARLALTGSTGIKSALPDGYEFDLLPYSGEEYPGIRFSMAITIRDIVVPA
jgi:hypothetical protein